MRRSTPTIMAIYLRQLVIVEGELAQAEDGFARYHGFDYAVVLP
jgi:hypothetical protein